ncbi:MAG: hypothetical protein ACLQE9_16200 [Roseiarcus sp.]
MFKNLILAALFAVSFGATVSSFTASAHAEIDDFSFDIDQVLDVGR